MKTTRKSIKVLISIAIICTLFSQTALAKTIYSLVLTINPEIVIGESVGTENIIINKGVENKNYDVSTMVINHKDSVWTLEDEPEILITITAQNNNKFKVNKDSVSVTNLLTGSNAGNGAVVEDVKVKNGGYDVDIKVKLAKLAETHIGRVESVMLSSDGNVSWDEAMGSKSYELRIMKDNQLYKTVIADDSNTTVHQEKLEVFGDTSSGPTGTEKDATSKKKTGKTKVKNVFVYDLKSVLKEKGTYSVEVIPLNGINSMIRGEKVVSGGVWMEPEAN